MRSTIQRSPLIQLLFVLLSLLPLIVLFLLPGGRILANALMFWLLLMFSISILWAMMGRSAGTPGIPVAPEPQAIPRETVPPLVSEVMDVGFALERGGIQTYFGRLREPADAVYHRLRSALPDNVYPLLQEEERYGTALILLPRAVERAEMERPVRPWINWLLFGLTVLTTTYAGAAQQGVNLLREPERFAVGLPFSLGLLAILGIHELGHYFTALRHGIHVTPPYFIPLPFALGTFGAFIQMKSPTENRRALFDVAVAGPLAGLVVAIPLLVIGLQSSSVMPARMVGGRVTLPQETATDEETAPPVFMGGVSAGSSLLLAGLAKLTMPEALRYGCVLQLTPLAFAGWLGIFITGLNLLPIGQLDGGHAARGMFGHRIGTAISSVGLWSLVLLGLFVWPGLLTWAIIVFFLARRTSPPLNDVTPLTPGRRWLGYATFVLLLLIIVPLPPSLWSAAGIHCPYVG